IEASLPQSEKPRWHDSRFHSPTSLISGSLESTLRSIWSALDKSDDFLVEKLGVCSRFPREIIELFTRYK
ncbi:hypothetical protein, partial [Ralstonia solanacearum]|uniref:hypothetical protein n=1 Tax=Ralstonia solanacearum TaxID=305 RepID=UPI001F40476B